MTEAAVSQAARRTRDELVHSRELIQAADGVKACLGMSDVEI
jgi:hypothetical protein